jgi:hypothetical protein
MFFRAAGVYLEPEPSGGGGELTDRVRQNSLRSLGSYPFVVAVEEVAGRSH